MKLFYASLNKVGFFLTWISFYSKTQNNLFSSFLSFPWPQVLGLALGSSTWLDPPACRYCARKKKIWAPNPITQDAVFQCLSDTPLSKSSTLCVKSIPSVWRICAPVGIVVQTHAAVYDALGRQKCFLPLSYLLNQSPPHVLLFQFVCVLQNTYLTHSVQGWLCGFHNEMPRKVSPRLWGIANLLLATFWQVCAATVQQKFSSVTYFCCGAILCSLCNTKCKQLHEKIMRWLLSFMSKVYSPKLFFLSAATAL